MIRRAAAVLLLLTASGATVIAASPNVLVVLTDDQGWGDLSCHGNQSLQTPSLDALAESGASFQRFYVQPVCAPTRAELLTGRWHRRDGVSGVSEGTERLDPNAQTLADAFRRAGYATACFGKWHNGTQAPYHPNARGFDEFYGFTSGHWGQYFDPMLDYNGRIARGEGYLPNDLTDRAIDFIRGQGGDPFFILLAYNTPHSPMQVPDRWWSRFAGMPLSQRGTNAEQEKPDHTRAALAMCENLDWNVGRLIDALERDGLADDTIVVFFSDNGPNGRRYNGGLRGIKGSTDEGGVRSPLFVRWPGCIAPRTVIEPMAAAIDLAPTLCDLADIAPPNAGNHDGVSLEPLLLDQGEPLPDRTLFTHWNGRTAARHAGFVLDHRERLYNLLADPGQTQDVADQHPALAEQLGPRKTQVAR
ncbi:MAG: arylsulfatase [Planctomycetota bacterium]